MCRVLPDVPAISRSFDYLVPEGMGADVRVGTIVRVGLRGRRVRGWVVEDDVEPEASASELRPLAKVSSEGPPAELVELSAWAAWRWAGPRAALLRVASPPNAVRSGTRARLGPAKPGAFRPASDPDVEVLASSARNAARAVVQWPPATRMAELLRCLVATDGSTIIVIPDVERVTALADHLRRAGFRAVAMHGDDPAAVRTQAWVEARQGGLVIVGGRVAAWAPVPDLSAVVLVDEADEAMKEERSPTWHARDVAIRRADDASARVTVVTPAPTLDVLASEPTLLQPAASRRHAGWGRVAVLDRREEPPGTGMFSPELVDAMRRQAAKGRVVCVLNRKGRARLLACGSCRHLVRCDTCGGAMAEDDRGLVCRTCANSRPRLCAECGSTVLRRLQPGIRRLREELSALLPRVEVAEVEAGSDAMPFTGALIGTEAVLHRVEDASLVAFLDFDQELLAPRFRAWEQALWLVVRAVRLTGPRGAGSVLVQTRMPEHEVIRAAVNADPGVLIRAERGRRAALAFPPFGAIAEAQGDEAATKALVAGVAALAEVEALGPVAGPGGRHHVLVCAPATDLLCDALAAAVPMARSHGRLRIDVDPLRA